MPVVRYAVCDKCGGDKIRYNIVSDREKLESIKYSRILDGDSPQFEEVEHWLVKARQAPEDPIAVDFQFYCPECSGDINVSGN